MAQELKRATINEIVVGLIPIRENVISVSRSLEDREKTWAFIKLVFSYKKNVVLCITNVYIMRILKYILNRHLHISYKQMKQYIYKNTRIFQQRLSLWSWEQTMLLNKFRIAKKHLEKLRRIQVVKEEKPAAWT